MRIAVITALVIAVGGCSTIRSVLGEVQKVGDQGVTVGGATTAPAEAEAPKRPALPGGLGGDTANRAYTSDPPKR